MKTALVIYSLIVLIISIAFLIDCIVKRRKIAPLAKYGLICASVLTLIQALMVTSLPEIMPWQTPILTGVLIVKFAQITLAVALGIYYSQQMRLPSLVTFGFIGSARRALDLKKTFGLSAAVAAGGLVYSVVLFMLTKPAMSSYVTNTLQTAPDSTTSMPMLICVVVLAALGEELLYRLGLQNFLAHHLRDLLGDEKSNTPYHIAIVLTSILWTMAHIGTLDPNWVKMAQIFPLGLALGYLYHRAGADACMGAHATFNFVMVFLGDSLITH